MEDLATRRTFAVEILPEELLPGMGVRGMSDTLGRPVLGDKLSRGLPARPGPDFTRAFALIFCCWNSQYQGQCSPASGLKTCPAANGRGSDWLNREQKC